MGDPLHLQHRESAERKQFLSYPWRKQETDEEFGSDDEEPQKVMHRASSTGSLAFRECEINKNLKVPNSKMEINQELKDAVEAANEKAVSECLLVKGANPNYAFKPANLTCLHLAAKNGNVKIIELLLTAGADANAPDIRGITPLHVAAGAGMVHAIELLVKSGAALNAIDWGGNERCELQDSSRVITKAPKKLGKEATANVINILTGTETINSKNNGNKSNKEVTKARQETPLHRAARKGQEMAVRKLISLGAEVNAVEGQGRTPLHLAAESSSIDSIQALLENNANPNAIDKSETTPIALIGESFLNDKTKDSKRFCESIEILTKAGALVNVHNSKTGSTPLHQAITLGHLEATKLLLNSGSSITLVDNEQNTPLHVCCSKGNSKILKILLDQPTARMIVNSSDFKGRTPLHRAAYRGSTECIQLLVKSGADLGLKTKSGVSAITLILQLAKGPKTLIGLFDESIATNGIDPSEHGCQLKFDYSILISKYKSQQMNVIEDILDNRHEQRTADLLQHPLVSSFLFLKWRKTRMLFFSSVITYIILVVGITAEVLTALNSDKRLSNNSFNGATSNLDPNISTVDSDSSNSVNDEATPKLGFHLALIFIVIVIVFQELVQLASMPQQYFQEAESYVKWGNLVSSSVLIFQPIPWAEWVHFVAAWAVLFGWAEVTFLLGRLPTFGVYALMFYAVAQHLAKFIVVFIFFLLGFSFSFQIIFMKYKEVFENPWTALLRTLAMMTGDISYDDYMTEGNHSIPVTAHLVYFLFIMLSGLVLMNLLIGLAVSDIQGLQKEGNVKRLRKQAQFIVYLEDVVNNRVFRFFFCKTFVDKVNVWINQKPQFSIRPSARKQHIQLPTDVVEDALSITQEGTKLTAATTINNDIYSLTQECSTSIVTIGKRIGEIEAQISELKQLFDESTRQTLNFMEELRKLNSPDCCGDQPKSTR